jgi:hypothetical protein
VVLLLDNSFLCSDEEGMKKREIEYCLANLIDILDICEDKQITKSGKERIYVKAGSIYDVLKNDLKKKK